MSASSAGHPAESRHAANRWLPALALAGLLGLLIFQSWAYAQKMPLSLGPRVILQPWLLRRGFVQYESIGDLHTPLMPLLLSALTPLVADGFALAKATLVALLSLTTLLTFVVGRRRLGWLGGLWAAGFVVAWSPAFGFGKLWHESFLAPLYLLLLLLFDGADAPRSLGRTALLGLVGGVAILVKQHAAAVLLGLVLWLAVAGRQARRPWRQVVRQAVALGLAASLPMVAFAAYQYARSGTLEGFFYWTVVYNLTSGYETLAARPAETAQVLRFATSALLLPLFLYALVDAKRRGDRQWLSLGWLLVLLVTSSLTAYPRFEPFHLQAALPVLALASATALVRLPAARPRGRFLALGLGLAATLFLLGSGGRDHLAAIRATAPPRVWEYSDLVPLAGDVRQQIGPEACLYVFPDDEATSNLYYLTGCSPPGFWIFHYPWYMLDWMRARILLTLQAHPPDWVVYLPGRWQIETYAPEIVAYLQANYRQRAVLPWDGGEVWLLERSP